MSNLNITIEQIKELINAVSENNLGSFIIKDGDFELKISGKSVPAVDSLTKNLPQLQVEQSIGNSVQINIPTIVENKNTVKSPIVGTFYSSISPDKPPFVNIGSSVKKGDVLFVIESMKLMNEIQSEFDGKVTAILVENAQGVEYGQPIMTIE